MFKLLEICLYDDISERSGHLIGIKTRWAALVSNSLFGWNLLRLYQILLESVLDVPRKLPLKFRQNQVSNS